MSYKVRIVRLFFFRTRLYNSQMWVYISHFWEKTTWSHGNSFILYEVANSYEFVRPHLYEFIWFLLNRMYFTSSPINMNLYEWPTSNTAPIPTCHWGLDKSYKIVQVRSYEFIWISHLVKYVRNGRERALENKSRLWDINVQLREKKVRIVRYKIRLVRKKLQLNLFFLSRGGNGLPYVSNCIKMHKYIWYSKTVNS